MNNLSIGHINSFVLQNLLSSSHSPASVLQPLLSSLFSLVSTLQPPLAASILQPHLSVFSPVSSLQPQLSWLCSPASALQLLFFCRYPHFSPASLSLGPAGSFPSQSPISWVVGFLVFAGVKPYCLRRGRNWWCAQKTNHSCLQKRSLF